MNNWNLNRFTYLCLLALLPLGGEALDSDQHQVLQAVSDTAKLDQQTGIGVYTGHVYARQGSTSLRADQVVTKQNAQHQVVEVIAYGQPAVYKTIPQAGKAELTATATEIHYYPEQQYAQLLGNAVLIQDDNRYEAPIIDYDMAHRSIASPNNSQGHTTIVLQPSAFNHNAKP